MLDDIVPGYKYKRRDGVIVIAEVSKEEPDYMGGMLILCKVESERGDDRYYRWRYNGPKPKECYADWEEIMVAGQCPRPKKYLQQENDLDFVECLTTSAQFSQLDLF